MKNILINYRDISAVLIIAICAANISFAQPYTLLSENDFWSFGYTVNNHTFGVETTYSNLSYSSSTDIYSTSCGIHEGLFSNLNSNASTADNKIKITPSSVNNYTNYTDGVSTLDLLRLDQHITGTSVFTNGFQKLSADAENDLDIDTLDLNQIRDLILGTRSDLDRNSWEWMGAQAIGAVPTGFLNDPWNYCSSNLGNVIEITGLTRTQIENGVNTGIRCTKIGDVYATSGTSANSWVCGSGSYIKSPQVVESRSTIDTKRTDLIGIGNEIVVSLQLQKYEDILSIELPIFLDPDFLEIKSIDFENGFSPFWHFNKKLKRLVLLQWNQNSLALENGSIARIHLISKKSNFDINKAIKFSPDRNVEISNRNMELANATVSLAVERIDVKNLDARILQSNSGSILEANVNENTDAEMKIVNINGQILGTEKINLNKGNNRIPISGFSSSLGVKVLILSTGKATVSLKFID